MSADVLDLPRAVSNAEVVGTRMITETFRVTTVIDPPGPYGSDFANGDVIRIGSSFTFTVTTFRRIYDSTSWSLRKRQWRLKVIRTSNLDESISEFIEYEADSYGRERKLPIWRIVPGAEGEKLPFGETLPSYSLARNGFKLIR